MAAAESIAPPPPGFELDGPMTPAPPEGFVVDSAPEPPAGFVLERGGAPDNWRAEASRTLAPFPGRENPELGPYTDRVPSALRVPLISTELPDMSFIARPLVEIGKAFDSPGQQLEHISEKVPALEVPAGIAKGAGKVVGGAADFMVSPLGLATMGLGAAPATVQGLASGAFALDMATHAPDAWQAYWEAAYAGDRKGQAEALTEGLGTLAMAGIAGSHGYGKIRNAVLPRATLLAQAIDQGGGPIDVPSTVTPIEEQIAPPPPEGFRLDPRVPIRGETLPEVGVATTQNSPGAQAPAEEIGVLRPGVVDPPLESQALTASRPSDKVLMTSPPAETITGPVAAAPDEGTASAMPAEREERPRAATSSAGDRPWDILDEIEGTVGKIDPTLIREADPNWKPVGAVRRLLRKGGISADRALRAITYEGPKLGVAEDTAIDEFGHLLNAAAQARKSFRGESRRYEKQIIEKGKQTDQFERRVLFGQRPKAQAANIEQVPVANLIEGDKFTVQGHDFEVLKLEFDEDANLTGIVVKDGPKFGVQTISPGHEVIHIDSGTLRPVPREEWPAVETPTPTALGPPKEPFSLGAPESVEQQRERLASEDAKRVAAAQREKLREEATRPLIGKQGDIGQGDLLGGGDLFSGPTPDSAHGKTRGGTSGTGRPVSALPAPPPGAAVGVHGSTGLPVHMTRTVPGSIDNPTVMRSLENVLRVIGSQVPIRTGRFYQRALGIYKGFTEVIRLRQADDIPTAAHEVAHAFSDVIFGSTKSRPLIAAIGRSNKAVIRELQALGKALYGSRQPNAGYTAEGLSELTRLWLTTEDAARTAPAAAKWLEETLLPAHPEMAAAMRLARDKIDIWRGQGAMGRAEAQMQEGPGLLKRLAVVTKKYFGRQGQVEEFEPLRELSQGFQKTSGRRLRPSADPYLIASMKRGSAGAVMETMVERGMVDIWGNIVGPGLKEALARVKPGEAGDFAKYLLARRSIERWAKGKNPGMAHEDAVFVRQLTESPAFIDAASKWYKWWDGLLEYVKQANPMSNTKLIEAIRAGSHDYIPLARILDAAVVKGESQGGTGGGLRRMHGSGLPIREIYQQSLIVAEKLVSQAHRDMVMDAIFNLAQEEGMGWLVEQVPRARAMETVNIEKIRRQLEDAGVDTSAIGPDELLKFATHQDVPKGTDPIMVRQTANGPVWYQVPARVYDLMQGVDPKRLGGLWPLLTAPNRLFKLGTTGLRASFSLVTNPVRDLPTFMLQSIYGNPVSRAGAYFASMFDIVRAGLGGKVSPEWETFKNLGMQGGMFLGGDIVHARREARALFHGRVFRRIMSPVETLREALSFTEAVPRLAEMRLAGKELGWTPGKPLTPDQAVAMSLAAKRITTDFSAAGAQGKTWNQLMPFYNASIQGTRAFLRAFRRDQDVKEVPHRALFTVLKGASLLTLPVLWNWWQNKDKEWYRDLPWRERYLYTNVEGPDGQIVQVPRPPEWGNAFMVAPEMLLDTWYRRDPESAKRGLQHIFDTQNPLQWPTLAETLKQQWQNEISFFNRPIVPRSELDLPPGEQRAYFTSKFAQALGDAFPNQVSPRRVDAAVRSLAGGLGGDALAAPDQLMRALGLEQATRPTEPADWPIAGRLFRRGGQFSANNQALMEFWDDYTRAQSRVQAAHRHARAGTSPLSPADFSYARNLENYHKVIKADLDVAARTTDPEARQRLYQKAAEHAREAMKMRPREGR